jgi:hypothetical protein
MKLSHCIIVVALLGGCAVQVAVPKPRPRESVAQNHERIRRQVCLGLPKERCVDYRNMLGGQWAVEVVLVNNAPQPVRPYCIERIPGKGCEEVPVGKLLFQEAMPIRLEGCEKPGYDASGQLYCRFTLVVYAYLVEVLPTTMVSRSVVHQRLLQKPVVDDAYLGCFASEVHKYDGAGSTDPLSHHRVFDKGKAPCKKTPLTVTVDVPFQTNEPPSGTATTPS